MAVSIAALTAPAQADGADKRTDGVYGRFDGDLDLSLSAGAAAGRGTPSAAVLARALYFHTAGIYLAYTESFGSANVIPPRSLAMGIALRPFFIPRWGLDLEHGPAMVDLVIDAITFDFGALWPANAQGHFAERPGVEAALGTEVPLFAQASGPWLGLRGALRWRGAELAGGDSAEAALGPAVFITFAWHFVVNAHLTDAGDRLFR